MTGKQSLDFLEEYTLGLLPKSGPNADAGDHSIAWVVVEFGPNGEHVELGYGSTPGAAIIDAFENLEAAQS